MVIAPSQCPACATSLPADAIFCPQCGAPIDAALRRARRLPPSLAAAGAAGAVLLALGLVIWRGSAVPRAVALPPSASTPAGAGAGAALIPDISGMSPQERFDRLYERVLQALRSGDTTTLSRIAPMALAAYAMIDSTSTDSVTRRRAAVLRLHLGDTTAARTLPRRASPVTAATE